MSPTTEQLAEAFSRHRFDEVYPFLASDVRWDTIGGPQLLGREAVVEACAGSAVHLATVTTSFTRFRLLSGAGFAIVDSTAEYTEAGGGTTVVGSCDIYRFAAGEMVEITSYTVLVESRDPLVDAAGSRRP